MLKLPDKDPLPVNELAKAMEKHVATIYRWGSRRGVRGHRLRLVRLGGRTYVYRRDWDAFIAAINDCPAGLAIDHLEPESSTDAELDAAGF